MCANLLKGANGVILVKTGQVLVAAVYKEDARHASVETEKLADKLIAAGY